MIKEIIEQSKKLNYVPTNEELINIEKVMNQFSFNDPIFITNYKLK